MNHSRAKWSRQCFTDGSGPEVFQSCSKLWVRPNHRGLDKYGEYDSDSIQGHGSCERYEDPPSALNQICKEFHAQITELKYDIIFYLLSKVIT